MRTLIKTVLLATCLLGPACSGGPKYKIDDALLADVSPAEKQGILAAQSEMNLAKEEQNKANSDLAVAERDVTLADSDYGKAKLDVTNAKAERELAESTKDMNRITAAKAKLADAELARDVADAKLDLQKQRRKFAKATIDSAEEHYNYAASHNEQEKARLAAAKGKQPDPNFNVSLFDQQAADRRSKWDSARAYAEKMQLEATEIEKKYNQLSQKLMMQRNSAQPMGQPGYQPQPAYGAPAAAPGYDPNYPPPGGQPGYQPQPAYGQPGAQPYGAPSSAPVYQPPPPQP